MKYIYIPKTRNIVFFTLFVFVAFLFNLPFLLMKNSVIEYNIDTLLLMHIILPIVYTALLCMLLAYFIRSLETVFSNFQSDLHMGLVNVLSILEILFGLFLLVSFGKRPNVKDDNIVEFLSNTIYFKSLITDEDITNVFSYWLYLFRFSLIAFSVVLFCAFIRQIKVRKNIKVLKKETQIKDEINKFLGFDYENCDFYQQINIPYQSLQQTDGTRGEFEVYHMLQKAGLTSAKYIFNREIPKNDGLNTELDLIVIHEKGIFVVENKHYTTRIYGNALDHDLTIIDHNGNKKSIYNPIRQNENHVVALKEFLKLKDLYVDDETTPIYSIVVFTAEGNDRTDNIISGISTVGTKTKVCTSQNVYHVINQLIDDSDSITNINISKINEVLINLPIRKKYS